MPAGIDPQRWTPEEEENFKQLVIKYQRDWKKIAPAFPNRAVGTLRAHLQKFQNRGESWVPPPSTPGSKGKGKERKFKAHYTGKEIIERPEKEMKILPLDKLWDIAEKKGQVVERKRKPHEESHEVSSGKKSKKASISNSGSVSPSSDTRFESKHNSCTLKSPAAENMVSQEWTPEEDQRYKQAILENGCNWDKLSTLFPNRSIESLMTRLQEKFAGQPWVPRPLGKRLSKAKESSESRMLAINGHELPKPVDSHHSKPVNSEKGRFFSSGRISMGLSPGTTHGIQSMGPETPHNPAPQTSAGNQEESYTVQEIISYTGSVSRPAGMKFKTRWVGYSPDQDTLEPYEHLKNNLVFHEYCRKNKLFKLVPKEFRAPAPVVHKNVHAPEISQKNDPHVHILNDVDALFQMSPQNLDNHAPHREQRNPRVPATLQGKAEHISISQQNPDVLGSNSAPVPSTTHRQQNAPVLEVPQTNNGFIPMSPQDIDDFASVQAFEKLSNALEHLVEALQWQTTTESHWHRLTHLQRLLSSPQIKIDENLRAQLGSIYEQELFNTYINKVNDNAG